MVPDGFDGASVIFTCGAGLIFIFLYMVFKAYEVFVQKQPLRFMTPAKEIDLHSDLEYIEALTTASDAQRASHKRTLDTRVSDAIF